MPAQSPAYSADPEPPRTTITPRVTPVAARSRVACFSIHAEAEPGFMPRVLELFAKRGLVPRRWISDVTGPGACELSIDVQVAGMESETQAQIAQHLRQVWGVGTVLTSERGGA
jgi:acetolactate synthase small subunit